jgi:2-polyprenyl-6-methoxyphenol hydroxylase-like FAD-dependent oxidoreductase
LSQTQCDVLVIGGGPALLAQRGRDVVLLEKSRHPRFHIGESLLPFNMPLFERLGVAREIESIGMPKYGAEFVAPGHERPVMFEFANALDNDFPFTYQVRRSEFDHILFRNAVRKGARAIEGCRVTGLAKCRWWRGRKAAPNARGMRDSWWMRPAATRSSPTASA